MPTPGVSLPTCNCATALRILLRFWMSEEGEEWEEDRACCSHGTCLHAHDSWGHRQHHQYVAWITCTARVTCTAQVHLIILSTDNIDF